MPRRGESIYKRKDGRWEGRYIDYYNSNGKAHYKSLYASCYADIKLKIKQIKAVPNTHRKLTSLVNMEQLSLLWLDNKKINLKESSFARYHQVIHGQILPYFKNIKLSKISKDIVDNFIKDKLNHGRIDGNGGLSNKSVSDILNILLKIIGYGEKKHCISNFDYDINRPTIKNNELPILSRTDQDKLIQYLNDNLDHKKLGVLLALCTGIRLGELCALKWSDIDFDNRILSITKTLQRIKNTDPNSSSKTKMVITSPKSQKSIREIPLSSSLINILEKYKKQGAIYILSGTTKYIDPRVYQDIFKRYIKEAVIDPINFHALRHTFATRAIEQKFDDKSLSELLGHATVRFTMERYVHSSVEIKRANMERFAVCV